MKIKMKFKFGDIVNHIVSKKMYIIVAIQTNKNGEVLYGCSSGDDSAWVWFNDFELQIETKEKPIGFTLELENAE